MLRPNKRFPLFIALTVFVSAIQTRAQNYFRNWPAGTSPQEIGRRVAENFVARKLEVEDGKRKYVIYPEVCAWYGSLTVAQLTNAEVGPDQQKQLQDYLDRTRQTGGQAPLLWSATALMLRPTPIVLSTAYPAEVVKNPSFK